MQKTSNPAELAGICRQIRRHIITMTGAAKSGHPGGSLSAVEILVTLYWDVLRHDPAQPRWPERDRFVRCDRRPPAAKSVANVLLPRSCVTL